jgi:hypothetical protein
MFTADGTPSLAWPAGWNVLFPFTTEGKSHSIEIRYKIADGTEGATITIGQSGGGRSAHTTYRITGHDPSTPPQAAAAVLGTDARPDPPRLTPAAGESNYLWLAVAGVDNESWPAMPVAPASYTNIVTNSTATGGRARLTSARRVFEAASEDPGPFTISISDQWIVTTIAIRPR